MEEVLMSPAHAILCWSDDLNIYCAPQATPDAVIAFRLSQGGLQQALEFLGAAYLTHPEPYIRPQIIPKALAKQGLSLEDLAKARNALKEMGII
jgi:hypothetical protein